VDAQQYKFQFAEQTLQLPASFTQRRYEQVKPLQRLKKMPPRMYLSRSKSRTPNNAPVLAVGETSSQAGGRLKGWGGFVTP